MMKGSSIVKDSSLKTAVMFFEIPAEGREVSMIILHWRKLSSKRQLINRRQLNDEAQLNDKGQLVEKSSDVFEIPAEVRPAI